jgi:hypothetical protein
MDEAATDMNISSSQFPSSPSFANAEQITQATPQEIKFARELVATLYRFQQGGNVPVKSVLDCIFDSPHNKRGDAHKLQSMQAVTGYLERIDQAVVLMDLLKIALSNGQFHAYSVGAGILLGKKDQAKPPASLQGQDDEGED